MTKDKQRWRNKGLWVSLLAVIPVVLEASGVSLLPNQLEAGKEAVMSCLGLLVVLGVLSDPTTQNTGFLDDQKREDN
ncbi:putative membrane protein [Croceifilum oryzae]|uniref:Membrane protein n=1 Tax=Croceifilum oryzae TaxID=1553429 RepID=A0AAJ1TNY6_9BACL|nr:phage holin [Croceifilum oryzae]MDQ0417931.1 putative membrane protein [Croceifilum oryzae]